MIHPAHAQLLATVRHRELVAEADAYRQARSAANEEAPPAPVPGTGTRTGDSAQRACRPYPGSGSAGPGPRSPGGLAGGHRRVAG